jgi:hypothetical protein
MWAAHAAPRPHRGERIEASNVAVPTDENGADLTSIRSHWLPRPIRLTKSSDDQPNAKEGAAGLSAFLGRNRGYAGGKRVGWAETAALIGLLPKTPAEASGQMVSGVFQNLRNGAGCAGRGGAHLILSICRGISCFSLFLAVIGCKPQPLS